MKTAAIVLNWITVAVSVWSALFMLFSGFAGGAAGGIGGAIVSGMMIFWALFIVLVPAVVCIIANKKLKEASSRNELTGIAIVTLILGNIISGILMLVMTDADL